MKLRRYTAAMRAVPADVGSRPKPGHRRQTHGWQSSTNPARARNRRSKTARHARTLDRPSIPLEGRVRRLRPGIFGAFLIIVVISAGIIADGYAPRGAHRPQMNSIAPQTSRADTHSPDAALGTSGQSVSNGDVPQFDTGLPLGDGSSGPGANSDADLSVIVQGLPPAPDDPDLEAALAELDAKADRDALMQQQHGRGQLQEAPLPGPPPAPSDEQPTDTAEPTMPIVEPTPGPADGQTEHQVGELPGPAAPGAG